MHLALLYQLVQFISEYHFLTINQVLLFHYYQQTRGGIFYPQIQFIVLKNIIFKFSLQINTFTRYSIYLTFNCSLRIKWVFQYVSLCGAKLTLQGARGCKANSKNLFVEDVTRTLTTITFPVYALSFGKYQVTQPCGQQ